jgi:hypothetical protein
MFGLNKYVLLVAQSNLKRVAIKKFLFNQPFFIIFILLISSTVEHLQPGFVTFSIIFWQFLNELIIIQFDT